MPVGVAWTSPSAGATSAGVQPQVVCGLTGHERTLQTALAGIQPTDGPTRVADAVELGKRLLADANAIVEAIAPEMRSGDVVAILSNGGFGGIYEKLPARLRELASNSATAARG